MRCLNCGWLDYDEAIEDIGGGMYCGLCGEDLPEEDEEAL